MNRDYSYGAVSTPSFTHVDPQTPDTVDYLLPLCSLCFRPGAVETVEIDGLLTYAHLSCVDRWVDTESPI